MQPNRMLFNPDWTSMQTEWIRRNQDAVQASSDIESLDARYAEANPGIADARSVTVVVRRDTGEVILYVEGVTVQC